MDEWFCIWLFLENKTSCAGLLRSGLKSVLQLKVYLEVNCRSSLRIFALSLLSLTIAKGTCHRQIVLRWILIQWASHWCRPEVGVDLNLSLREPLLKLVSKMTFVHLKSPFGIYLLDIFQEGYNVLLRSPYS